MPSIPQ